MVKRTIYIGNPSYLKLKDKQLLVLDTENNTKGRIAIEDIAFLVLDNYQITFTSQLLIALQENNTVVITCNDQHLPLSMALPLFSNSEYSERVKHQINLSEPLKKQLWKQTVVQKIKNQQVLLKELGKPYKEMDKYWQNTLSGDTTNTEGKAAQHYWKHLIDDFVRDRYGGVRNDMLNYGYAILRGVIARALVSSGLLPVLGIFHKNKYNPYCLADDIMEPYRPFVDKMVVEYLDANPLDITSLNTEVKAYLLKIVTTDVWIEKVQRPLMVAVTTTTASLYKCYVGVLRQIKYPTMT